MNVSKRLLSSLKLTNSFYSTHFTRPTNQVIPLINKPIISILHFSSKPEHTLNLISSQTWSKNIEQQLINNNPHFNHETVMYVLKKLSKDPKKAGFFFTFVVDKLGFQPSSSIYSLMLRVYANKETIKDFWVMVHKMKEEGCFIDDQAYLLIVRDFKGLGMVNEVAVLGKFYKDMVKDNVVCGVVKKVVDVLVETDCEREVVKKLNGLKFDMKMSDNFVLRVLKSLRKYPLKAVGFFRWVCEEYGFEHGTVTYNGILRVIGQEDSIDEFWSVCEEMKGKGYEMDLDTYLKITRLFQKRKMLKEAVELYEFMMDSPYKPSVQDCSVLLRTLAGNSSPDMSLVFRVVDKFKETGNSLSKSVYDGIHRSLTSLGQFDEAEKIMTAMKEAGYEPDNITFSQLIFGLCKARRLEDAAKVIDLMEEKGCVPDMKTWTILIQGHCSANEVEKAVIFLATMIEKGCEADADLLDVLINGFLGQKKTIGGFQVLMEMVKTGGVKPFQETYKNLIRNLLDERKFEESLELLKLMKKHDYPPFSEPFIGYVSKYGTVDDALEFLKALSFKETPSISAYMNVFQSLFAEGREFDAKDLLFKCPPNIRKHKSVSTLFGSGQ